jgi:protein-S-isoprenylcysteine O-methyltransferase Ste14
MIRDKKIYDALMRLPIVAFTLFLAGRELLSMRSLIATHPYFGGDWAFFTTVAARVSVVVFLVLLVALHAMRRRPVSKYETWGPKITALLGLTIAYVVLLLPRAVVDPWWDGLSAALIVAGNTLCVLAVLDLGRSLSIMPEARKLVTSGFYSRIRHPLYLAEEIAFCGLFLQFRSWQAAVVLIVHFYFQIRRMDWEERILAGAFTEYADYQRRSHRLIPGVY